MELAIALAFVAAGSPLADVGALVMPRRVSDDGEDHDGDEEFRERSESHHASMKPLSS